MTIDHINFIPYIKECTYAKPNMTKEEFENIAISLAKDDEDKIFMKDLLKYLNTKISLKPAELWNIEFPY